MNESKIMRVGKTARDHERGAWAARFENRALREQWQKMGGPFPYRSCNGKKNRLTGR